MHCQVLHTQSSLDLSLSEEEKQLKVSPWRNEDRKRRPGMFGIKSPVREGIPQGGRAAHAKLKRATSLKVFAGWQC